MSAEGRLSARTVHSALPDALTAAAGEVLAAAGIAHVAHGDGDPVAAAGEAAGDETAVALLGPYRSGDVAEAVEATGPAGLALMLLSPRGRASRATTSGGATTPRATAARSCASSRGTPSSRSASPPTSPAAGGAPR